MAEDFFIAREGETPAPVPAGPILCQASAAMRRVHRVFLWAYDEAPELVRSATAGDREWSTYVGEVLANFDAKYPQWKGRGYEIAGFGWHQGWNDGCDMGMCQQYEENLKNLIRDVRKALGVEKLPFVIADSGFGGTAQIIAQIGRAHV